MLTTLALAAAASAALSGGTTVFLPTSEALHVAETVARAEGYRLDDRRRYAFDLITRKDDHPFLAGYVTFGFYWDGDTVSTISINERTGLAVDPVACQIFDYPSLRADRTRMKVNGSPPDLMGDLKTQSGCESFRTLTRPQTPPTTMRSRR